ncbi:ATPase family associated with various cellular activities (AAA) [Lotmaria passim]
MTVANFTDAATTATSIAHISNATFIHQHMVHGLQLAANAVASTFDCMEQQFSPALLCVMLFFVPFIVGAFRALRPLVESWCVARTFAGGTAVRLPYIHRNIEVCLPRFGFIVLKNHNVFLQNAVLVYVCDHLWREHPLPPHVLNNTEGQVLLMDPYRSWRSSVRYNSPFQAGKPVKAVYEDVPITLDEVDRLRVVKMPSQIWTPTTVDGIELMFHQELHSVDGYSEPWTRYKLTLRCPATPGSSARLHAFVKRALEAYAEQAPGEEKSDVRWFFTYGGEAGEKVLFQQYVLRSNKGFDTLFFPRRDATLTLIDQFVQQRGRFAVEGIPQKLGFLVYGPAGTGRHTFVKALAAYTGRHVVSVPLSKLRTNQQLYDIFFVREFHVEEDGSEQRLRMEDVIFLFDDVDASEPAVCARTARRVVQRRGAARLTAREGCSGDGALTNCVIEMDTTSSRPVPKVEDSALPLEMLLDRVLDSVVGGDGADAPRQKGQKKGAAGAAAGGGVKGREAGMDTFRGHLSRMNDVLLGESKDKLDLAGLLNVLDGVVDTPGQMTVMITEHPEWLDPALIRPGRFSVRLRFDYIEMAALMSMLGLYYGDMVHTECGDGAAAAGSGAAAKDAEARARAARAVHRELSGAQAAAVRAAVAALEAEADARGTGCGYRFHVTPCEVEMLCMEQDTLDGFLSQLADLVRGTLTM